MLHFCPPPCSMAVVGIDCRFGSALAGLGTFTRNLTAELLQRKDGWSYVLFVKSAREEWLSPFAKLGVDIREAPFPHYSFREQADFPNLIQDAGCDLFHSPHFNVPFFCPIPFTCTVHDLILHRFPNEATLMKRLAYRFVIGSALRNAKHVCAVSQSTKADIASFYGTGIEAKTSVTYPGASAAFRPQSKDIQAEVRMHYGLEKPFLLYVGNCKEHKNVRMLIDAFTKAGLPGIELVCVAGGIECAHVGRHKDVRFIPTVPPEDLPALYSAALGCVTATLMEGFCLPLIEAMACRTPVLATNVGPIPEVCGEHALLSEPTVTCFSDAMRTLVLDPSVRSSEKLSSAEKWAARFSWNLTASATAHEFKSILERLPS